MEDSKLLKLIKSGAWHKIKRNGGFYKKKQNFMKSLRAPSVSALANHSADISRRRHPSSSLTKRSIKITGENLDSLTDHNYSRNSTLSVCQDIGHNQPHWSSEYPGIQEELIEEPANIETEIVFDTAHENNDTLECAHITDCICERSLALSEYQVNSNVWPADISSTLRSLDEAERRLPEFFDEYFSEKDPDEDSSMRQNLAVWAVKNQIKRSALNELLLLLRSQQQLKCSDLPTDGRSLINTPRSSSIDDLGNNGKYWHYGVKKALKDLLSSRQKIAEKYSINVNIDGLPLFRSSLSSFWPILIQIHELRDSTSPLIIGIYNGKSKYYTQSMEEVIIILINSLI